MTNTTTRFSDLNLSRHIASALEKIGYETPTPIQQQAIPEILLGRDIQGIAQTGTGKTAAFALPILSHIADDPQPAPKRSARVLALSPTRELASQIGESMKDYARHIEGFRSTVIFGGVPISKQVKKLVPGNDVIVATPGRLLDLLGQKIIHLKDVEYLILDEADQMMDMGFIHTLRKIIPLLPEKRQTLFFSATMPKSISKLASQFLTNPVKIAVTPESTTAERVQQSIIFATKTEKPNLLSIKLLDPAIDRALVFTRTKHGADRVVKRLATIGLDARAIHGNKSQSQRTRALAAFKSGDVKFLIATDVAARGIDIRGVSHVFNYEIPNVPEQYVHRIGRTGRAGEAGIATSFVAPDEKAYLKDIQKILKQTIAVDPLPDDFSEQSKALKKRPALEKAPEPVRPARRQKDRKSRPSRHRKGNSNASTDNAAEPLNATHTRSKKKTDPKNPSRAERKRQKAGQARKPRDDRADRSSGGSDKQGNSTARRTSGTRNTESEGRSKSDNRRDRNESSEGFKPRGKGGKRPYKSDDNRSNDSRPQNKSGSFKRKPRANNEDRSEAPRGRRGDTSSRSNKSRPDNSERDRKPRSKPARSNSPQSRSSGERSSSGGGRTSGGGNSGGGWSSPKRKNTGRKPNQNRGKGNAKPQKP